MSFPHSLFFVSFSRCFLSLCVCANIKIGCTIKINDGVSLIEICHLGLHVLLNHVTESKFREHAAVICPCCFHQQGYVSEEKCPSHIGSTWLWFVVNGVIFVTALIALFIRVGSTISFTLHWNFPTMLSMIKI